MCDISNWLTDPITWTEEQKQIVEAPKPISENESYFENMTTTIEENFLELILSKVSHRGIEQNVQSTYPIIHEYVLQFCANFLLLKRSHGTKKEQKFYKNMNLLQFIDTLFGYRNTMFPMDNKFHSFSSLCYLEVDRNNQFEIDLADFLSLSSYTFIKSKFTEDVNKQINKDEVSEVIIIELMAPADETGFILTEERIKFKNYKPMSPEIYNLYSNFYKEKSLVLKCAENVEEKQRIRILENGRILDMLLYKKRLAFTCDTLLLDTNHRARERNMFSYLFILKFGCEIWQPPKDYEDIFIDVFGKRMCCLGQRQKLNNISDIHFVYFKQHDTCFGYSNGEIVPIENHPNGGIKLYFSNQNPYSKIDQPDKLQVIAYPGNCNSLPSDYQINRYRTYSMEYIFNPFLFNNRICADNLMVATVDGVMSIQKYIKLHDLLKKDNSVINPQTITQSSEKKKMRSCCVL